MVANHRSDDGMVTIHRSGLVYFQETHLEEGTSKSPPQWNRKFIRFGGTLTEPYPTLEVIKTSVM